MSLRKTQQEAPNTGPVLSEKYLYFDTAAAAPPVVDAVKEATDYLWQTAQSGPYLPRLRKHIYTRLEEIRNLVADFLGAHQNEVAFTRNGTESICLVARGLTWQKGDEIIIPDTEMLSNIAIWYMIAEETGAKVVTVRADRNGVISPETVRDSITDRTRLVTFASVSNVTGVIQPTREICEIARSHGVYSHVNAAQALGVIPVGFDTWPCDFISACTRKGLRGLEGSGILTVRERLLEDITPTLAGWWNASLDEGSGTVQFPRTARKLEAGSPNVPAILALGAAVKVANTCGLESISTWVQELTAYAGERLRSVPGADIYGPEDDTRRIGILPFNISGIDANDLARALEAQNIIIEAGHFMATPILAEYGIERMARISIHYFNTKEEIDRLIKAIINVIGENHAPCALNE
ncbi:aminotransferase class V-fold PLP-dependent enzyme [Auritidibacter sp. NML130574]|uniref:aminotransferase class V-fold PLP-dependent enzyme n=1 Tax=Auritidibacter sp. NML130574 TaxID=2170745 RepID=UPI000D736574|nr:aminotransferase class V-fold PLP-dependent enzyme [Auritidibacter sp. NML130574]AXR73569.1 aminotransferase class V-fold PLP-dependent enzyme [Auritidibacter sp. NML130574]